MLALQKPAPAEWTSRQGLAVETRSGTLIGCRGGLGMRECPQGLKPLNLHRPTVGAESSDPLNQACRGRAKARRYTGRDGLR